MKKEILIALASAFATFAALASTAACSSANKVEAQASTSETTMPEIIEERIDYFYPEETKKDEHSIAELQEKLNNENRAFFSYVHLDDAEVTFTANLYAILDTEYVKYYVDGFEKKDNGYICLYLDINPFYNPEIDMNDVKYVGKYEAETRATVSTMAEGKFTDIFFYEDGTVSLYFSPEEEIEKNDILKFFEVSSSTVQNSEIDKLWSL